MKRISAIKNETALGKIEYKDATRWHNEDTVWVLDLFGTAMKALGLAIRIDAIGNVTGIYAGEQDLPMVMMGSYIVTVGTGGLYDSNYGVMAGLEVIATLQDAGICPLRPVAVKAAQTWWVRRMWMATWHK